MESAEQALLAREGDEGGGNLRRGNAKDMEEEAVNLEEREEEREGEEEEEEEEGQEEVDCSDEDREREHHDDLGMENGRRRSGLDDDDDDEFGACLHSRAHGGTGNILTDANDDDDDRFLADVEAEVDELAVVSGRKGVGSHDQGGRLMKRTTEHSVGEEEGEEEDEEKG
ncbi:hypothetical protein CBR_g37456 [Chara braunii]|uniref:Uncharacterized protein n=1 Tax=Chara braunii TaxID=69332 RepID=A0A388LMX9_CHABU|nr:hypothetical protein CBR_g37456 [Chara braunii]|eukprot:GBG83654.1 hypothetical protein CBR_g37456 [Chara braunii]